MTCVISRYVKALIIKEFIQVIRDPSSIIIAFVLPILLLFIFGYGVNLDNNNIKIGIVAERQDEEIIDLVQAFKGSRSFDVVVASTRAKLKHELVLGNIRGIIIIPEYFGRLSRNIQLITDGTEPNVANFLRYYVYTVVSAQNMKSNGGIAPNIAVLSRVWYNEELKSRNFLVPGSIAIIMSLISTLLTALVIAREWEQGTMESIIATPISITQVLLGKLLPYFLLGIGSMVICLIVAIFLYNVPFRGSIAILVCASGIFLIAGLGQGLFISSIAKDQFVASQIALMSSFLPSLMLSGFLFEISAMPPVLQVLTHIFAVKYFVTILQTIFLTGNVLPLIIKCILPMGLIALLFLVGTFYKTKRSLDV
ncbi:ABC transporter permease [Rickettsiales endosymbiont of Peranema trichophorum]|uniref:ABC transporter permease n=1 Tax=Rickettsiales endosymbiont of Peranema trichophorum TaxID=2486577 RepID=UPI001022A731|nr:ABC transporter permease [Rickettsiales endosymbiont of Peranema trichophorum]RZI47344.1 ABC transporter permease [Rickettsiales endosymbiont of Peranema trichophorum]